MTFDDDYSAYWVYFINFLGTLAVLPGNIVSALLMDKVGRLSMLGEKSQCFSETRYFFYVKHVMVCCLCRRLYGVVRHQLFLSVVWHE